VVDVVVARITDDAVTRRLTVRPWDMAIVNEERDYDTHLAYLEALWDRLSLDGSVVVDRVGTHPPARQAYHDFCRRKSREPYVFGTRYGAGIITK
jgi:predicted O-methyltransferase YrrM